MGFVFVVTLPILSLALTLSRALNFSRALNLSRALTLSLALTISLTLTMFVALTIALALAISLAFTFPLARVRCARVVKGVELTTQSEIWRGFESQGCRSGRPSPRSHRPPLRG